MKYIKKYEFGGEINKNKKYEIGDYVVIDLNKIERDNPYDDIPPYKYCIIFDDDTIDEEFFDYFAKFYDNFTFYINDNEIERYMTTQEIEEFKIKKDTNKYNL